jgi:uncharacterized protein (TIGR03083 family)
VDGQGSSSLRAAHLTSFERDAAALVGVLRPASLDAPVPSCPGWRLRELGAHVGGVHRWAARALRDRLDADDEQEPVGDDVAGWVEAGAAALHELLAGTDPDAPRWGLGPEPQTAAFWVRRQAHETSLHRWDAELAVGAPPLIDPALALDGVAEVAHVLYPRQVRLGRREPLGAAVGLVAPEGRVLLGEGVPSAQVHGPAEALLLVVWGRRDVAALLAEGTLGCEGDRAVAVRLLEEQLVP